MYGLAICSLSAQCTPAMAESCEEAVVICSLDELNGYSCNNPSTVPSFCSPLCTGGGVGHNTSWWAFTCNGGEVSITISIGGCITNQGLQFGIWGDCSCGEDVVCNAVPCAEPGSVNTIKVKLEACKTYFLWVDGCSGDICDFTINTSLGGSPSLGNLGSINNAANSKILEVCEGACQIPFFINELPNGCNPNYLWTCHGMPVGGNERKIYLDFPKEGDFEICVSAYIGNLTSGSICSQTGPECIWVKVRKAADRMGSVRIICWEQVNGGNYNWHDQRITGSGIYRQRIHETNCCSYDSVVEFKVLEQPKVTDVFYISFRNKPYIDATGKSYDLCADHMLIDVVGGTELYRCDSTILLTAVNVDPEMRWQARCQGDRVELKPEIKFIDPCNLGESIQIDYRWFIKDDPLKKTIHTDSSILVDRVNKNYCLELRFNITIGSLTKSWTEVYCETFQEEDYKDSSQILYLTACDSLFYRDRKYFTSTQVVHTIDSTLGCDHKVIANLNILKSSTANIFIESCDSAIINGRTYTQSGKYTQWMKNHHSCDSFLIVDLKINESIKQNHLLSACDSIIVGVEKYFHSGIYRQVFQTLNGCDSILDIELKMNKSNESEWSMEFCDSMVINGRIYRESGMYIQHLKNTAGCDSALHLDLSVKQASKGILEAGKDRVACQGDSIHLEGRFSDSANFIWHSANGHFDSADELSAIYYATTTGVNRIFLKATGECNDWLDSLTILVQPNLELKIQGDPVIQPCKDNYFYASGGLNYLWSPAGLTECLDHSCSKVLLKSLTENTILSVSSNDPCMIPTSINLFLNQSETEIYFPNVFTPNNDQINDIFHPITNGNLIHNYRLNIFDRWGTLVFESSNLDKGWNGVYRNVNMNPGVYTYVVHYDSCNHHSLIKSGNVTLIR